MEIFYYKQLTEIGEVKQLLSYNYNKPNITNPLIIEITKEEHSMLLSEFGEKRALVWKLYNKEITIDDIKPEWQEEIQKRVDEITEMQGPIDEQEISDEEFTQMIEEVL